MNLFKAASVGDLEGVQIRQEADLNKFDEDGWTALMHASRNGHLNVVKYLSEERVAMNTRSKDFLGFTPLMLTGMGVI